jgi:hypothetical protein
MALKLHLTENRYARSVQGGLSPQGLNRAVARREADDGTVRMGWIDTGDRREQFYATHRVRAAGNFVEDGSDETWGRLRQAVLETNKEHDGATGGEIR